ncbi:hypothetical protein SCOR_33935 [Sulfidibacter corallicola]
MSQPFKSVFAVAPFDVPASGFARRHRAAVPLVPPASRDRNPTSTPTAHRASMRFPNR